MKRTLLASAACLGLGQGGPAPAPNTLKDHPPHTARAPPARPRGRGARRRTAVRGAWSCTRCWCPLREMAQPFARGQDTLTPAWKHIAGGCHLNRRIDGMVGEAGFQLRRMQTGYLPGPKPMTFMYEGCARPG